MEDGMALDLFAGIPVSDYAAALPWYERPVRCIGEIRICGKLPVAVTLVVARTRPVPNKRSR